jgi:uncharacterized protein (DUF2062 family)
MRKRSGKSLKLYFKLMRHPGTPESVGRGVAVGLFSAFITPLGQMPLALLLALPLRGAKGAAVLSTWVTNPLNMPVVYPVQCYLGSFIIGNPLSYEEIKLLVLNVLHNPSMETWWSLGGELVASFLAGGVLFGLLSAVPGYFLTIEMVRRYRARKIKRKEFRMNRWKTEGR